jgi:hypothetical protein
MSGRFLSFGRVVQAIIISSRTFANFLRGKCHPFASTGDVKNCKSLSPSSWHHSNCMRLLYSMTSREDRKCSRILGRSCPVDVRPAFWDARRTRNQFNHTCSKFLSSISVLSLSFVRQIISFIVNIVFPGVFGEMVA